MESITRLSGELAGKMSSVKIEESEGKVSEEDEVV